MLTFSVAIHLPEERLVCIPCFTVYLMSQHKLSTAPRFAVPNPTFLFDVDVSSNILRYI